MRTTFFATAIVLACLLSACSEPPPPESPMKPAVGTLRLMNTVVDPAADILWASVATIMTEEGTEDIFPRTEAEWTAVVNACIVIAESGNLLMVGDRAVDDGDWQKFSQDLIDVGLEALAAAEARDPDEVFTIGGHVYDVCTECHEKYIIEASEHAPVTSSGETSG